MVGSLQHHVRDSNPRNALRVAEEPSPLSADLGDPHSLFGFTREHLSLRRSVDLASSVLIGSGRVLSFSYRSKHGDCELFEGSTCLVVKFAAGRHDEVERA